MDDPVSSMAAALEDLPNSVRKERRKDGWDKASVVAQFLSGVLIGFLGISINWAQQGFSRQNSDAQNAISSRQQVSNYLDRVVAQADVGRRADLLDALDIAVPPNSAVPIAMHYAHPSQDGDQRVFNAAIQVLGRLKISGKYQLDQIAKEGVMPDADIAAALLGASKTVKVRASQIDDFGKLSVNGRVAHEELTFGQDSDWIDIMGRLQRGVNHIDLSVRNGPYGGFSGRLQVSAGTQQYDSGKVGKNACPCDKEAFYIDVQLLYDEHGNISLAEGATVFMYPP